MSTHTCPEVYCTLAPFSHSTNPLAVLPDNSIKDDLVENTDDETEEEVAKASPDLKGKGGDVHKSVQKKISTTATERGLSARIEEHIGNGKHIDVVIRNGDKDIACEISVSTSIAHERANVEKCITAGFQKIWVISESTSWIESFRLTMNESVVGGASVEILTSDEAITRLQHIEKIQEATTIGGRSVAVEMTDISKEEKERREIVLAKILS